MSEIDRLKKELEEIKQELASLKKRFAGVQGFGGIKSRG
jgi:hypothetical protein